MLVEKILSFCSESLSADFFSIHKHTAQNQHIISNYPEAWVSHYKANCLWESDPAINNSKDQKGSNFWGEDTNAASSNIILEARAYNIRSGVSKAIRVPTGASYTITLSSTKELSELKSKITPLELSQIVRYGLILDRLLSHNMLEGEFERIFAYLKYDADIYKDLKRRQDRTLTALHTFKSEIKSSSPLAILDHQIFLTNYTMKIITDLDQS